ncbi:MAG: hypothetical protein ACP5GH_00020 [Nitrososphaeria archaeon]
MSRKSLKDLVTDFKVLNTYANIYFAIYEFALGLYVIYLGGTALDVGFAYAIYNASWAAFIPLSSKFVTNWRVRASIYVGFVLLATSLITFSFFDIPYIYISVFLLGFSSSIISTSMLYLVSAKGGFMDAGIFGDLMFYGIIGSGLGAFVGFLMFLYGQITGRYLESLRLTFLSFGIISILAIINARVAELPVAHEGTFHRAERQHFRMPYYLILFSTSLLGIGQGIVYPMIVPFVVSRYRATPLEVMLVYVPAGLAWFFTSRIAGRVINSLYGRKRMAFITLTSALIAFILPFTPNIIVLSLLWGVEGAGLALWTVYMQHMISKELPSSGWGFGFGSLNGVYYTSYAAGSIMGSSVYFFKNPALSFWSGALIFLLIPLPVLALTHFRERL